MPDEPSARRGTLSPEGVGDPARDAFTIRDLVRECAVTARTLRVYEEKGLLTPLDEVRELLDLYDLDDAQETQLRAALSRFRDRIARLEHQKIEIEWVIDELRRASETVASMLDGRQSGTKPRVRMRAARQEHDPEKLALGLDPGVGTGFRKRSCSTK